VISDSKWFAAMFFLSCSKMIGLGSKA